MSNFTVSGLSSGIDYAALIEQLVTIKRQRDLQPLQDKKSTYQSKLTEYGTLGRSRNMASRANQPLR